MQTATTAENAGPGLVRLIVPLAAALLGTAIYHRYSLLTGLDRVQADPGDSRFIAFLLEHWRNALHGLIDWRSPPIFWPRQDTLAYSDLLVGMGVIHDVLRSGLAVFPAMNLQLILLSLATFASAYLLFVRGFALSVWGATAGAYFFAFSWPRFANSSMSNSNSRRRCRSWSCWRLNVCAMGACCRKMRSPGAPAPLPLYLSSC